MRVKQNKTKLYDDHRFVNLNNYKPRQIYGKVCEIYGDNVF